MPRTRPRIPVRSKLFVLASVVFAMAHGAALAQTEGGLYIAGDGFTFQEAAERAMSQNPGGQRFFVLAIPPHTRALTTSASAADVAVRDRVLAANGVLLVCQRDLTEGRIASGTLASGVVAVRGFPPAGSQELPPGERYFRGENPANLPASTEALRRLRTTCSS
jgi:hypothetical protein